MKMEPYVWLGVVIGGVLLLVVGPHLLPGALIAGDAASGFAEGMRAAEQAPPEPRSFPWVPVAVVFGLLVGVAAFGIWFEISEARADGREARAISARIHRLSTEQNRAAIEADVFRPVSEWIAEAEAVAVEESQR